MFGRGETRLQPTNVEDVAEAVAMVMQRAKTAGLTVECGGPRIYSYEEIRTGLNERHLLPPLQAPSQLRLAQRLSALEAP